MLAQDIFQQLEAIEASQLVSDVLQTATVGAGGAHMPASIAMYDSSDPALDQDLTLKNVKSQCQSCGSDRTTNHGGSTRGTKYRFMCDECGWRYTQNRVWDPLLGWDIKESKFAIEGEIKRSDGYKCGVCGMKKRENGQPHICSGQMAAPPSVPPVPPLPQLPLLTPSPTVPTPNVPPLLDALMAAQQAVMASRSVMDVASGEQPPIASAVISAPVLASVVAEPVAQSAPEPTDQIRGDSPDTLSVAAAVLTNMCDSSKQEADDSNAKKMDDAVSMEKENAPAESSEDDESEHEDAWPVGKTRVRVDGRIEICKMRQIVRHGVPCKGMEFYWESMPSLKPTMQATPSAKVDASLFAPLPPMASSLLGLSDDQTTGSSMTIETAVANVVANAAKVAADVVSSVSSVTTTPDSSKKLPMQTDDNLPTVSTDDTAPHITGIDVIRQLQLSRYRVCGDGSCTNYAVLATAGLCEHANTRLSKPPTPLDRGRDAVLRVRAYDLLERDKKALNLSQEDTDWLPSLLTMPKYPLTTVEDMGTFGTMLSIRGIAQYIGVTIVVWNKKTLRNISARQQVAVYSAATDSTEERMWSCSDIVQAHATSPLMHIEWDGVNHYSALVGLTPVRISPAALAELTTAPRVTEKDEDEGDALPDGWSVFSNQYREPSKMSGPKTIRGVQEQCADALRKGFNAFIVLSDRVFYLQYSANLTTKDVMPVADMQVQLYAFSDKKKKKLKMERLTDFSCCGQLYLEKSTDLACLKCDRSFHVSCILKSIGISESKKNEWLTRHADSWLCRDCCKKLRQ